MERQRHRGDLAFDARVVRLERPWLLEAHGQGELAGVGRWPLFEGGDGRGLEWSVHTTRPWMNRLAPVARPLFAWNHDAVMTQGGRALAEHLRVPLLAQG